MCICERCGEFFQTIMALGILLGFIVCNLVRAEGPRNDSDGLAVNRGARGSTRAFAFFISILAICIAFPVFTNGRISAQQIAAMPEELKPDFLKWTPLFGPRARGR
jgi:hypothetical protein